MTLAGVRSCDLVCITGRFQPLHRDHVRLMLHAAGQAERLIVAITNPYPANARAFPESEHRHRPDANPFTFIERQELVRVALAANDMPPTRFVVVPFDLGAPGTWPHLVPLQATQVAGVKSGWELAKLRMFAEAGYPILAVRVEALSALSSTAVRGAMLSEARDIWTQMVPPATVPLLEDLLLRDPIARRIEMA
jgi:nicotinamide-nucleotide adenylyltransferase